MQLQVVGTGPWEFVEFVADSHVKLKRYRRLRAEHALQGHATASAATRSPASTP